MNNAINLTFSEAAKENLSELIYMLADDELGMKREDSTMPPNQAYINAFNAIDSDANNELIIAKLNNEVIGLLQLTFIPYLTHQGAWRCLIEGVRVRKEYRGQGYGTALIQYAIDRAKQRQCTIVQLASNKQRSKAIKFYKQLGFVDSHIGFKLQL
jgi:GNAT superfamily N-acetyltransferase